MKTSITFLKKTEDFEKTIEKINATTADFLHVDIADGIFVNNKTIFTKEMMDILKKSPKEKDIHLMTLNLVKDIDTWSQLNPAYITFQYEATTHHDMIISYIKQKKCKVGIAISPLTKLEALSPYLDKIDLVLVMAIIPGYGGQKFLESTPNRVQQLKELKEKKQFSFLISVDGGINAETIKKFFKNSLNIAVSGSFICSGTNYEANLQELKRAAR